MSVIDLRSQIGYQDSLYSQLSLHIESDSMRVQILNNIAQNNLGSNLDTAYHYIQESISLATEIGYDRGLAIALRGKSIIAYSTGHYDSALLILKRVQLLDEANNNLGGNASTTLLMGTIQSYMGRYENAVVNFTEALRIGREIGSEDMAASALNNLGFVYFALKDFHKSLEYYNQALTLYSKLKLPFYVAGRLNNIGQVYFEFKDYDSAYLLFQKALVIADSLNNSNMKAKAMHNSGETEIRRGNYQKAKKWLDESLLIEESLGNNYGKAQTLTSFGELYSHLSEKEKSIVFFQRAIDISREIETIDLEAEILELYSRALQRLGDLDAAIDVSNKFISLKDSILNAGSLETIQAYEIKAELDQKSLEVRFLGEQISYIKTKAELRFMLLVLGATLLVVSMFFMIRINHKRLIIRSKKLELTEVNYQLAYRQEELENALDQLSKVYRDGQMFYDQNILLSGEYFKIKDIKLISVTGNNSVYWLTNGKHVYASNQSMKRALDQLPESWFVQINRNEAINLDLIKRYRGDSVILLDDSELKVSEKFKSKLLQVMKNRGTSLG